MNLRPYQQEDVEFLSKLNRGACFNEQRTGKTPTILSVIDKRQFIKPVIICPKSAVPVWKTEQKTWLPNMPFTVVDGSRKQKEQLIKSWTTGSLIISFDSFKETAVSQGFISEILAGRPDILIVDEAHRIQNRKTATAKAIFKTTKIPVRFALTGTPVVSRTFKIWSILHWLYPEYFRGYWKFIHEYFYTDSIYTPQGRIITQEGEIRPEKAEKLWEILAQFSTQRKRADVMPWLPQKDRISIILEPTAAQVKYLEELERYFETEHISVPNILTRLIRYRQICLDPTLLDLKGESPKTQWILDYITDYPDEKILIFSKFSKYLNKLYHTLWQHNYNCLLIDGSVNTETREQTRQSFQKGDMNILLLQIDAAREALTLDEATTEIFTDKYPPVGYLDQAEDRFVATTEDKADKPHKIYELQLEGTYDEVIYSLCAKRADELEFINNFKEMMKHAT